MLRRSENDGIPDRKGEPYSEKVDVFATGVVLYFALSRTLPFADSSVARVLARTVRCKVHWPKEKFEQCSGGIIKLIKSLLAKAGSVLRRVDAPDSTPETPRAASPFRKMIETRQVRKTSRESVVKEAGHARGRVDSLQSFLRCKDSGCSGSGHPERDDNRGTRGTKTGSRGPERPKQKTGFIRRRMNDFFQRIQRVKGSKAGGVEAIHAAAFSGKRGRLLQLFQLFGSGFGSCRTSVDG
eukprot:g8918.t1